MGRLVPGRGALARARQSREGLIQVKDDWKMIISMGMGIIGSGQSGPRMSIPLFLVEKEIGLVDSSWLHWEWTRRYFREVGGWKRGMKIGQWG